MRHFRSWVLILLAGVVCLGGCATVNDLLVLKRGPLPGPSPHVFGGARTNLHELEYRGSGSTLPTVICFADLLLCLPLDAVLLPITVPIELFRPEE